MCEDIASEQTQFKTLLSFSFSYKLWLIQDGEQQVHNDYFL